MSKLLRVSDCDCQLTYGMSQTQVDLWFPPEWHNGQKSLRKGFGTTIFLQSSQMITPSSESDAPKYRSQMTRNTKVILF